MAQHLVDEWRRVHAQVQVRSREGTTVSDMAARACSAQLLRIEADLARTPGSHSDGLQKLAIALDFIETMMEPEDGPWDLLRSALADLSRQPDSDRTRSAAPNLAVLPALPSPARN